MKLQKWSKAARAFAIKSAHINIKHQYLEMFSTNTIQINDYTWFNAYHADSSAAIFVNGILVAAIEEERFRRVKHWAGFPSLAIQFCLKEAGHLFKLKQLNSVNLTKS